MKLFVDTTEATDLSDNKRFRDPTPAELLEAARPHADLEAAKRQIDHEFDDDLPMANVRWIIEAALGADNE